MSERRVDPDQRFGAIIRKGCYAIMLRTVKQDEIPTVASGRLCRSPGKGEGGDHNQWSKDNYAG